jgi:hypothetical protein
MDLSICSRLNSSFMAITKSGLAPGPLSRRMIRSVYETPLVSKMAALPLPLTRSIERGLTVPIRSSSPASSALTRAVSSAMPTYSISSR